MYECGMRLGTELFNHEGLKRQAKSFLACINCLKLVNSNYAWIVKPVPHVPKGTLDDSASNLPPGMSPKRNADGEEIVHHIGDASNKPNVEVLEVEQIEKELELVCARLKLFKRSSGGPGVASGLSGPGLSSSETVSLLVASNLFEDAVRICRIFDLDYQPALEGLASRCVRLASRASAVERDQAWDWLRLVTIVADNLNLFFCWFFTGFSPPFLL